MSKNEKYFKKLNKIKKGVTWESSKKTEEKEKTAVETIQELKTKTTRLKSKVSQLEAMLEEKNSLEQGLKNELVVEKATIKNLERHVEETRKELTKYQGIQDKYIQASEKLIGCLETLQFYAQKNHYEKGTFGDKILDKGEKAQKCIDKIFPKESDKT